MKKTFLSFILFFLTLPLLAIDCSNLGSSLSKGCEVMNDINTQGKRDIYLTGYHWYPQHQTNRDYQRWGVGGGLGKSLTNEAGNEHMVYGLAFADQNKHAQLLVGYAYQAYWDMGGLKLGVGHSIGLTSRKDKFHRVPFPYILPLVSVKIQALTLYATYIPKFKGTSTEDRVFLMGKYTFN